MVEPRPSRASRASRTGDTASVVVDRPPRPAPINHPGPHPIAQRRPPDADTTTSTAPAGVSGITASHYLVAIVPTLLAVALFLSAHGLVDAEKPDAAAARTDYVLVIILGVLTVAGGGYLASRSGWYALAGVGVGVAAGFWLRDLGAKIGGYWCGTPTQTPPVIFGDYTTYPCDPHADISGLVTLTTLGVLAGAGAASGILHAMKQTKYGHALMLGAGLALTTGFAVAAALLMPGLDDRAAAAEIMNRPVTHNVPGFEVLVVLGTLAILTLAARRRRA